ncbi:MAG TPA: NADH-quinone oxidoreductase subunit A [Gemmataceae bacterium]|jgi:NADH-quinone oxidoreductase subunit A|nr:NADH-quinone oxidoreductase subunit A [Gemmataceae bacterium]
MTPLVAYVLLFVAVGAGFIFVHLMAGKFIRPSKMDAEKGTIYECGEPTIGSAWVQFDLRFYVVALLFVIFDVEVAFFFPWAEVFGRANALASVRRLDDAAAYHQVSERALPFVPPYDEAARVNLDRLGRVTPEEVARLRELRQKDQELQAQNQGLPLGQHKEMPDAERAEMARLADVEVLALTTVREGRTFAWLAFGEILVFFGVLLVGFAYLWKRGDLAWVRSVAAERQASLPPTPPPPPPPLAPAPRPLAGVGAPH